MTTDEIVRNIEIKLEVQQQQVADIAKSLAFHVESESEIIKDIRDSINKIFQKLSIDKTENYEFIAMHYTSKEALEIRSKSIESALRSELNTALSILRSEMGERDNKILSDLNVLIDKKIGILMRNQSWILTTVFTLIGAFFYMIDFLKP